MGNRIEITGQSLLSPDYSCGATLDKVAEITGIIPRKPGESDEKLRERIIEEMRRLDSLSIDNGPPPNLFPFKRMNHRKRRRAMDNELHIYNRTSGSFGG